MAQILNPNDPRHKEWALIYYAANRREWLRTAVIDRDRRKVEMAQCEQIIAGRWAYTVNRYYSEQLGLPEGPPPGKESHPTYYDREQARKRLEALSAM